jgi:hypothetical protein
MAEFDRVVWNPRERPLSSDSNREASYTEMTLRAALAALTTPRMNASSPAAKAPTPSGFLGDGLKCYPPDVGTPTILPIAPGLGFWGGVVDAASNIGGVLGVDDTDTFKPLVLSATENITLVPNGTVNDRVDLIEVRYRRELLNPTAVEQLDPGSGVFLPNTVNKTLTWELSGQQGTVTEPALSTAYIGYKVGIPSGAPVPPTLTPGYIPLAYFRMFALSAGFSNPFQISDERRLLTPYGMQTVSIVVSIPLGVGGEVLLGFDGPPGFEPPAFTHTSPVVNNTLFVAFTLHNPPLGVGDFVSGNRVTFNVEMLSFADDQYPVIVGRSCTLLPLLGPTGIGTILNFSFNAIILKTLVAAIDPALLLIPHQNPTVFRITLNYW